MASDDAGYNIGDKIHNNDKTPSKFYCMFFNKIENFGLQLIYFILFLAAFWHTILVLHERFLSQCVLSTHGKYMKPFVTYPHGIIKLEAMG